MVLSVMFLFFLRFLLRSYSIWFFIMVHPIVLFFIVYFVCVSCIIYDTLAVFVLWDREWMMPLRFIRSTNTVLFLIFYAYFLLL